MSEIDDYFDDFGPMHDAGCLAGSRMSAPCSCDAEKQDAAARAELAALRAQLVSNADELALLRTKLACNADNNRSAW